MKGPCITTAKGAAFALGPAPGVAAQAYARHMQPRPIDLALDANEGASPPPAFLESWTARPESVGTYPSVAWLEERLAAEYGVEASNVIVTAGADDALERACRAVLCPGREAILTDPTFEMLARWIDQLGAGRRSVPWMNGAYPLREVASMVNDQTGAIFVVSPNNPTGLTAEAGDVLSLAEAAPGALVVYDLAYVEFAEADHTREVLGRPNVLVTRTFSKAWGLAGLRVGFALGPARVIEWLRRVGLPYACSGTSAAIAGAWREQGRDAVAQFVGAVRHEREKLTWCMRSLGADVSESQGNFVLSRHVDGPLVADLLAGLGIGVRRYPPGGTLDGCLRITVPGRPADGERLRRAMKSVLAPRAILFDMDGVLVDVSASYRAAIVQTAEAFGVHVTPQEIRAAKAEGNANNDWVLTHRLVAEKGVSATLAEVTEVFESLYQGTDDLPGLRRTERLLWSAADLAELAREYALGIVTGRPRRDAAAFLDAHGLTAIFKTVVCMEDAPAKPSPLPVQRALEQMGVNEAWMIGDTVDDVRAARAAGVVPLGFVAPGETPQAAEELLFSAGAARVLTSAQELALMLGAVRRGLSDGGDSPAKGEGTGKRGVQR